MQGRHWKVFPLFFICPILFPSHHPRHPSLRLDEFVPVEPLVQLSERFAAVALDMILEHTFSSLGSTCTDEARIDLKSKH